MRVSESSKALANVIYAKRKFRIKQKRLWIEKYGDKLTVTQNRKGVLDVDVVKGCTLGMRAYPNRGCYGACYACALARAYVWDFAVSVSRTVDDNERSLIERTLRRHPAEWFRIGVMGDPCHDWDNVASTCEWLYKIKTPVVLSKHWVTMKDDHLRRFRDCGVVFNTSISALDTECERLHRIEQWQRIGDYGIRSMLRIVSCRFGDTEQGIGWASIQAELFAKASKFSIDNPLRIHKSDKRVLNGDIIVQRHDDLDGGSWVSIDNPGTYIGTCKRCPDQCGVLHKLRRDIRMVQPKLFQDTVTFEYVEKVLGSEYQNAIAKLAIEDKVAYRAARKNMQIHSAIVMLMNGEFVGFFTFQVNHAAQEFCLLQSAMVKGLEDENNYRAMVQAIIDRNTFGYPMLLTCSTKHKLERPVVFEKVGFRTYLNLSGYAYMVYGTDAQVRMKRLAHATMTNAWTTTRADWLAMKHEWNAKLSEAGKRHGIDNPGFASRDGCWQAAMGCPM